LECDLLFDLGSRWFCVRNVIIPDKRTVFPRGSER
jgi:hypothetical protein